MGEHRGRAQPSSILPNGLLPNVVPRVTRVLDVDRWLKAEERTAELISCIQPNPPSEERRNAVANFVEQLITNCISCQVFKFGSVPLKTYLPDGDIDLTACSGNESLKDSWANAVRDMLEKEEKSENAEFRVKEVQYIQAEVKLIKCLVENIVVDISFNQVGGLCTLCFLQDMDKLINQNHLFKRSIILIKAWCYYESRILGAHHGLISTYALETLVLYIFHIFNNSFVGPLEVLYRFLEFFSNFDWDNFCVSLWGPVPISSLPNMTAEPPRKDSGKLLLSKGCLDQCSRRYAVIPGGQEIHSQPFVSKHFNVVDPLRTNNNLGRSVSKGNFFRIRSAFTFGAKRLARLLDCPKEEIIAEINQFFMNTWERHGNGNRPDVPNLDIWDFQPSKIIPFQINNQQTIRVIKKNDDSGLHSGQEQLPVSGHSFQSSTSEVKNNSNQNSHSIYMSSNPSTVFSTQSQMYNNQASLRVPDQVEGNSSSSGSVQSEKNRRTSKINYIVNDREGKGRFQFARVRSSPELTEASLDLSQGRRVRAAESPQVQNPTVRLDYSRRKNPTSEVMGNHSSNSCLVDPVPVRHTSSHKSVEVNFDSNIHRGDIGFGILGKGQTSVSETLEMQQEEQDMINSMDLNMQGFHGPVQFPLHVAPPHIPFKFSPMPASVGFPNRNLAVFPSNVSLGPSWGHTMQFPPGFVPSPLSHYYPVRKLGADQNDVSDAVNDSATATDRSIEVADHGMWYEHEARTSSDVNSIGSGIQKLHLDVKPNNKSHRHGGGNLSSTESFISLPSARSSNKIREDKVLAGDDHVDSFHNQASKSDGNSFRAKQKSSPIPQVSSRSKPSENLREEYTAKYKRLGRDTRQGRKPASSSVLDPSYDKIDNDLQYDNSSNHVPSDIDDELTDWNSMPRVGSELSERISGPGSLASQDMRIQPAVGFDPAIQRNGADPMIPFQVLVSASSHSGADSSKLLPIAFVPTGPPVPFYFLPMPLGSNTENSGGSENQLDQEESDSPDLGISDKSINSKKSVDEFELLSSNSLRGPATESSESNFDILNSDYNSHIKNLEFGRSCQNLQYRGQVTYTSPVLVPPVYLQGHQPWDGSGRPITPNLNFAQMVGYGSGLVPLVPFQQPGPDTTGFQRLGNDAPRYRGGTGTYLPIPKSSFRERQSSSRNHRGNYNHDRNSYGDREGNWTSAKQRANRNRGRNQGERTNSRTDRAFAAENQAEGIQEPYRHDTVTSYPSRNSSLGPTNMHHGLPKMIGVYPQGALTSNGIDPSGHAVPPMMMMYPVDRSVGYASSSESFEFGTLGPVHLINENEASKRLNAAGFASGLYEQRHSIYRGVSPQSSPDESLSP